MAADPRAVLTLLLILFIIFTPTGTPNDSSTLPAHVRERFVERIARERRQLDVLSSSRWGDFEPYDSGGGGAGGRWGVNITGLEEENGFAWAKLGSVKERVRARMGYLLGEGPEGGVGGLEGPRAGLVSGVVDTEEQKGEQKKKKERVDDKEAMTIPLYKNVSGVVHGEWVRSPVQEGLMAPVLNMSLYAPEGPFGPLDIKGFGRNFTDEVTRGYVRVVFEESDDESSLLSKSSGGDTEDGVGNVKEEEKEKRDVLREIRASVNFGSENTGDDWEAQVYGVHFLETGNIVLTTTSDKFAGIFALPHLLLSKYNYGLAQEKLNQSLTTTIQMHEEGFLAGSNPWSSAPEGSQGETVFSTPKCELVLYLQQHPVSLPASTLPVIEKELRDPTGAFPPPPSDMRFSLLAFSPDCGYILESRGPPDYVPQEGNHLTGLKVEVEYLRARQHVLIFSLVLFGQIWLLMRQMRDASTPSTRSRVSFYTIAMLSLGDGFTTMTLCLASLFVTAVWIPLIGSAFLAFMSVSFFGMRFLLDIYTVQAPERERAERARSEAIAAARAAFLAAHPPRAIPAVATAAGTSNNDGSTAAAAPTPQAPAIQVPIITAAGADTLPLPVTAPRPPPPTTEPDVFIPSDQDITQPASPPPQPIPGQLPTTNTPTTTAPTAPPRGTGFGALYTRFYFLLLATLFLSLNASSWPPTPRRIYFTLLSLLYLSLWLPQIHRNIHRNCRRALRWDFVAGQSALRLVPFVYFYGYAKNVLFARVDFVGLGVLAAWLWIQVLTLASQEILGPRWFLVGPLADKGWVPVAYDYHPLLHLDEEGGNLPVGATEAFAVVDDGARRKSVGGGGGGGDAVDSARKSGEETRRSGERRTGGRGRRLFDCAICMGDLEVPVFEGSAAGNEGVVGAGVGLLERRRYMVTPCRHIFHSTCLEGWMKYRLQCPVCREELPPV